MPCAQRGLQGSGARYLATHEQVVGEVSGLMDGQEERLVLLENPHPYMPSAASGLLEPGALRPTLTWRRGWRTRR